MAISFIDQATATATSVTIPGTVQVGDILIIFAYRAALTAPSLPAGWTNIATGSANSNSCRIGYRIAVGSDTSGTWTNATQLVCQVYRGVASIGNFKTSTGASSPASFTAMTLNDLSGTSWLTCFIGSTQGTSTATPTGLTNRDSLTNSTTSMVAGYDTNSVVLTQSLGTSALGVSTNWFAGNVELIASGVKFVEPGGDADFGIGLWPSTDGTPVPTASTTVVHGSHLRSILYDNTNANTSDVRATNVASDNGGRASAYYYHSSLGNLASNGLLLVSQSGNTNTVVAARITSAGVATLNVGGSGTQIGSNGPTLSTGLWYRICLCWTITSTTVNSFKLYINGVLACSGSNVTLTNITSRDIRFGNCSGDTSTVLYTSDHYVDNNTSLNDTGDIWVTAKRPNANGTSNQFTTQIGASGSGYGAGHSPQVNERPESDTNGWSISTTTLQTEEYNIEGKAVGDIDVSAATVIDYMGWVRASEASTSNTPVTHIIVNGTSVAIVLTTAAAYYKLLAGSASYPAGSGTDIGMDGQYTTTPHLFSLFECGVVVAYTPSSVPSISAWSEPTSQPVGYYKALIGDY